MKDLLLSILAEKSRNLPVQSEIPPWHVETVSQNELQIIFDTSDNKTFYGFDIASLTQIFGDETGNETFYGFDITATLAQIFESELENRTFYGFDVVASLTQIFANTSTNETFYGFDNPRPTAPIL